MFTYKQKSSVVIQSIGTFGVTEDTLYYHATLLSIEKGIPLVYMSCNSGARIKLSEDLLSVFNVEWIQSEDNDWEMAKGIIYKLRNIFF